MKHMLWTLVSLLLISMGCGGKKEGEAPDAFEQMRKKKQVIIITDPVNPPFVYGAGADVQGLDVDIGNAIGKDLGFEVKWVKITDIERQKPEGIQGYEHLFEVLKKGEAQIILSSIAVDPKRTNEFAFSTPYFDSGDVIAHQKGVFEIKDLAGLSGKKVGVCTGRPGDVFLSTQKTASNIAITRSRTLDDALGALGRTELNAVVGDEVIIAYSSVKSFPNTATLPGHINSYRYAAVVRKNDTELLAKINETIDRLKTSGELQKLTDKWVGNIVAEAKKLAAADKKQDELKRVPKTINVNIQKISGKWNMDRLDGFILVLDGPTGQYQSTHITTEGNSGSCKFTRPVPPGDYRLNFSILGMTAKVVVPDLPKSSLGMSISIGGSISILFR